MTSHEDNAAATPGEPGPSAWFRPPRRRRKALLGGAGVVFVVVVYLVYLMARGPDNERMAERLVESTLAALPVDTLSASSYGDTHSYGETSYGQLRRHTRK